MTDFDAELRDRLSALEAAVPVESWSGARAASPSSTAISAGGRRRRRMVVLLAAAALLVVVSVATAQRIVYPDVPEPELEAAVERIWAGRDCVPAAEARAAIQRQLSQLGYAEWVIRSETGADAASCSAAAVLPSLHEVRLVAGIGRDIERAKDVIIDGLLSTCMGRADAIQFVSSVLTSARSDPFVVRSDPLGPKGGPIDKWDRYLEHVAAGCTVYVGMPRRDAEGRAVHELWGPWP